MAARIIADARHIELIIHRLCFQLMENHGDFKKTVLAGIQPRGVAFANRVSRQLAAITGQPIHYGTLDATFHRDDYRRADLLLPNEMRMPIVENQKVVLIDDVLYSGRTVRAAMDALLDFGRPDRVELMALVDRRFRREFPLQADYVGLTVDTLLSEKVKVEWGNTDADNKIWIV